MTEPDSLGALSKVGVYGRWGSNTSLDFAELTPSVFARVGNADTAPHIGISSDGGQNWYAGQEPSGITGGGTIAVGADANAMVWVSGETGLFHSTDSGTTFTQISTVTSGVSVALGKAAPGATYPAVFIVGTGAVASRVRLRSRTPQPRRRRAGRSAGPSPAARP
jgi:hypothetical protein